MSTAWRSEKLVVRYRGADQAALGPLSLEVPAAVVTAVIGPNGSGKSTLLRALLGTQTASGGDAWFAGRRIDRWSRVELARCVGVVSQSEDSPFPLSVREVVGMGRYPHLGLWRAEAETDRRAVQRAMERCDLVGLASRAIGTLSGGERQRARLARALAQEPEVLALDEPTAALDIAHEMAIWELLRELGAAGTTVLVITHNLNLAARYADRLILLDRGQVAAAGVPELVLTREHVERVYAWPVEIARHAGAPQVIPLAKGSCPGRLSNPFASQLP